MVLVDGSAVASPPSPLPERALPLSAITPPMALPPSAEPEPLAFPALPPFPPVPVPFDEPFDEPPVAAPPVPPPAELLLVAAPPAPRYRAGVAGRDAAAGTGRRGRVARSSVLAAWLPPPAGTRRRRTHCDAAGAAGCPCTAVVIGAEPHLPSVRRWCCRRHRGRTRRCHPCRRSPRCCHRHRRHPGSTGQPPATSATSAASAAGAASAVQPDPLSRSPALATRQPATQPGTVTSVYADTAVPTGTAGQPPGRRPASRPGPPAPAGPPLAVTAPRSAGVCRGAVTGDRPPLALRPSPPSAAGLQLACVGQ